MSLPAEKLKDLRLFVPGEIDDYPFLPVEFRLFCRVARRGKGGCFDSLKTLATAFRVSERTITRTFRVLTFCGAVVRLDHPARYEPRPFSEWATASDLDKIRGEVWGKKPQRRTRRRRALTLVCAAGGIAPAGDSSDRKSDRLRCLDRPSPVSQSAQTPGTDEGNPISEGKSLQGVKAHTSVENFSKQKQNPRKQDPEPVRLYRKICRQAPNYYQRQEIIAKVTDPDLWERVLCQFMIEKRSPDRVDWLLERYFLAREISETELNDQPMRTIKEQIEHGQRVAIERGFNTSEFLEAWGVFVEWRTANNNPVTPAKAASISAQIAPLSEAEAIAVLRHLLPDGWHSKIRIGSDGDGLHCAGCGNAISQGQQFAERGPQAAHVGCLGMVAVSPALIGQVSPEVAACHA